VNGAEQYADESFMKNNSLSLEEAYAYCRRLTLQADSNFALSFRFLPKEKRNAIYAVYAFNRCADDFADEPDDSNHKLNKLEKWEYWLNECYNGSTVNHPIMVAFSDAIRRYHIPKEPSFNAMQGFKLDLSVNRYNTFEELTQYCDLVAGTISIISLHIFGYMDNKAFEYGKYLSYALQLTNIIRDVGTDIDKNRIYIPLEELNRFAYTESDLLQRKNNKNFHNIMHFQINRAQSYFKKAQPLISMVENDAQYTVALIGAVYNYLLSKIYRLGIPVLDKTVRLSTIEKWIIAVKTRTTLSFG